MLNHRPEATMNSTRRVRLLGSLLAACALILQLPAAAADQAGPLAEIQQYISEGWQALTRSMTSCETFSGAGAEKETILYLPANFPTPEALLELQEKCPVRVAHLPAVIRAPGEVDLSRLQPRGLLYLENPYIVPGGRFNEMYGWDSYFILRGLLRAGRIEPARGMVENFFFEIEHYGMILNANRAYFLTRSQPPFLTSMILALYDAEKAAGRDDRAWLGKAYPYAVKDYQFWTTTPHLAGKTGLSRYYGLGEGVSADLVANHSAVNYFRYVVAYLLRHPQEGREFLARDTPDEGSAAPGPLYSLNLCNPHASPSEKECAQVENVGLQADFYEGDRSMRESGFDISFRFGPFGGATHHFAPVGLNSLLYKAEKDLERMSRLLGRDADARRWSERAKARKEKMNRYFWDAQAGLFFDYDFTKSARSTYEYLTTFYPLWAGWASAEQAQAVARNLPVFEQPGGLAMSRTDSRMQWDYPYGWAPLHLIAIEGLRRYGYAEEANRISYKFLSMVQENFLRDATIREKYNVVTRSSETQVQAGYRENVIGFGWTNGVFLELLHQLPAEQAERLGTQ
jgi:alpha,alpha-trehalase